VNGANLFRWNLAHFAVVADQAIDFRFDICGSSHDAMWFALRDLAFGDTEFPEPMVPENIARPEEEQRKLYADRILAHPDGQRILEAFSTLEETEYDGR
jgi:hypothetical protein